MGIEDINKAIRINELARDMLKQGVVSSFEEGLKIAEGSVKGSNNSSVRSVMGANSNNVTLNNATYGADGYQGYQSNTNPGTPQYIPPQNMGIPQQNMSSSQNFAPQPVPIIGSSMNAAGGYSNYGGYQSQQPPQMQPSFSQTSSSTLTPTSSSNSIERLEVQMERNNRKIMQDVTELIKRIESLEAQLKVMQQYPRQEKQQTISGSTGESSQEDDSGPKRVDVIDARTGKVLPPKGDKDAKHHRTGQFKPGDIDINKMFYYGR